MKIIMTPDEMIDFVSSGKIPESAKQNFASGIFAICNSPEMTNSILSSVEKKVNDTISTAVKIESNGYPTRQRLSGWASQIMLSTLENKIKELDLKEVVTLAVTQEVKKQFDSVLRKDIQDVFQTEYKLLLIDWINKIELEPIIESKVKTVVGSILTK